MTNTTSVLTKILLANISMPTTEKLSAANETLISSIHKKPATVANVSLLLSNASLRSKNLTRKRRYDYEDIHEWPPDDSPGYDFDDDFREEELTLWQEVGRNWQTVALRSIFLFCFMAFIAMIVAFCIYINCAVCCDSLTRAVCFWRPAVEYLSQCYQDPMYAKARDVAEAFGIKLDYKTYMKIQETHGFGGRAGWNPLQLE